MRGIYYPLRNSEISCAIGGATFYGYVDGNGTPYSRLINGSPLANDTGWLAGTLDYTRGSNPKRSVLVTTSGVSGRVTGISGGDNDDYYENNCFAPWPMS